MEFYVNIQQNRSMITCLVPGRIYYCLGGISDIFLFSVLYNAMCGVAYSLHMLANFVNMDLVTFLY